MYDNEPKRATDRDYGEKSDAHIARNLRAGADISTLGVASSNMARVATPTERHATIVSPSFLPVGELVANRFINSCGTFLDAHRTHAFDGFEYQVSIHGSGNNAHGLRELGAELCSLADHLDGRTSGVIVGDRVPHAPKSKNSVVRKGQTPAQQAANAKRSATMKARHAAAVKAAKPAKPVKAKKVVAKKKSTTKKKGR